MKSTWVAVSDVLNKKASEEQYNFWGTHKRRNETMKLDGIVELANALHYINIIKLYYYIQYLYLGGPA